MLLDRINSFHRDIEFLPTDTRLVFTPVAGERTVETTEFIITAGRIMYSPTLKTINGLLTGYLAERVNLSIYPYTEAQNPNTVFIDFKLLVWMTIKESVCCNPEDSLDLKGRIFVKCVPGRAERYKFLLGEKIESLVLIYFHSYAKPMQRFLEDYSNTDAAEFYRCIIALALIGVVELTHLPLAQSNLGDRLPPPSEPTVSRSAVRPEQNELITPEVLQRVRGLMRILQNIKQ